MVFEGFLKGQKEVLDNINKELSGVKSRISKEGMHTALLIWRREAMKLTPVATGNLINSYTSKVVDKSTGIEGILANHASYALHVHEMPKTTKFQKPTASVKFVEIPLRKNTDRFLAIFEKTARIK